MEDAVYRQQCENKKVIRFSQLPSDGGVDEFKAYVNLIRFLGLERMMEPDEAGRVVWLRPFCLDGGDHVRCLTGLDLDQRLNWAFGINAWSLVASCPLSLETMHSRKRSLRCAICGATIYRETQEKKRATTTTRKETNTECGNASASSSRWIVELVDEHNKDCTWTEPGIIRHTAKQKLRLSSSAIHMTTTSIARKCTVNESGFFRKEFERSLIVTIRALVNSNLCHFLGKKKLTAPKKFFRVCKDVFGLVRAFEKLRPGDVMTHRQKEVVFVVHDHAAMMQEEVEVVPEDVVGLVEQLYQSTELMQVLRDYLVQEFREYSEGNHALQQSLGRKSVGAKRARSQEDFGMMSTAGNNGRCHVGVVDTMAAVGRVCNDNVAGIASGEPPAVGVAGLPSLFGNHGGVGVCNNSLTGISSENPAVSVAAHHRPSIKRVSASDDDDDDEAGRAITAIMAAEEEASKLAEEAIAAANQEAAAVCAAIGNCSKHCVVGNNNHPSFAEAA